MNALSVARHRYQDIVGEAEGNNSREVGRKLGDEARRIEDLSKQVGKNAKQTASLEADEEPTIIHIDTMRWPVSPQAEQTVTAGTQQARDDLAQTMEETGKTEVSTEELAEAGGQLEEAGKTLSAVDVDLAKKEGNVVGDARMGQRGSAELDGRKVVDEETGLVDERKLRAVYIHEVGEDETEGHEHQVAPDSDQEQIGAAAVTAASFAEVAPIIAQIDKVPESEGDLAPEYRTTHYRDILALLPDRKRVKELSMKGQFKQFAAEARARLAS